MLGGKGQSHSPPGHIHLKTACESSQGLPWTVINVKEMLSRERALGMAGCGKMHGRGLPVQLPHLWAGLSLCGIGVGG